MAEECWLICPRYTPPRFWVVATNEESNESETHEVTDLNGPTDFTNFLTSNFYRGFSFKLLTSQRDLQGQWSGDWKSIFEIYGQPELRIMPELPISDPSAGLIARFPTGTCHPADINSIAIVMSKAYKKTAECRALYGEFTPRSWSQIAMKEVIIDRMKAGFSLYYICTDHHFVAACLLENFPKWYSRPTMESLKRTVKLAVPKTLDMDMYLEMHRQDYDTIQSRGSSGSALATQPCLVMTLFTFAKKFGPSRRHSDAMYDKTFVQIETDSSIDFDSALLKKVIDDVGHERDIYVRCSEPDIAPFFFRYGFDETGRTELQPKGHPQLNFTSIGMFRKAAPWAPRGVDAHATPSASNIQHQTQPHQEQGNSHSHMRLQDQGMASNNMIIASSHRGGMDPNSQYRNAMIATATGKPKPREFRFVMSDLIRQLENAEIATAAGNPEPREFVFVAEEPHKQR